MGDETVVRSRIREPPYMFSPGINNIIPQPRENLCRHDLQSAEKEHRHYLTGLEGRPRAQTNHVYNVARRLFLSNRSSLVPEVVMSLVD